MAIRGFIELSPAIDQRKIHEIVEAAQKAASDGRVVLILCDRPVEEPILAHARDADLVIADSERLSAALLSNGILHMRTEEGLFYLRSLASEANAGSPAPVRLGEGSHRRTESGVRTRRTES